MKMKILDLGYTELDLDRLDAINQLDLNSMDLNFE
jgi:hypothetical protein